MTEKKKNLLLFAKKKKILLGNWYSNIIDPKGVSFKAIYYTKGTCPVAENFAEKSLNLPTYHRLSLADLDFIISIVNEYGS